MEPKKEKMKLVFFQIWINTMRGLTAAGANHNEYKESIGKKLESKYPDYAYLGNGWRVFVNPHQEDVEFMKLLAKNQHKSFSFFSCESASEELLVWLNKMGYTKDFKESLPLLIKNIDEAVVAPNGEPGKITYVLSESIGHNGDYRKARRVIVSNGLCWSYPMDRMPSKESYFMACMNGQWSHWEEGKKINPIFV